MNGRRIGPDFASPIRWCPSRQRGSPESRVGRGRRTTTPRPAHLSNRKSGAIGPVFGGCGTSPDVSSRGPSSSDGDGTSSTTLVRCTRRRRILPEALWSGRPPLDQPHGSWSRRLRCRLRRGRPHEPQMPPVRAPGWRHIPGTGTVSRRQGHHEHTLLVWLTRCSTGSVSV